MERVVRIDRSTRKGKKYRAFVKGKGQERFVHFGSTKYQHYKDTTPLALYTHLNHGDKKRRARYFSRHSGGLTGKRAALRKELSKSKGLLTPKILSHRYLW